MFDQGASVAMAGLVATDVTVADHAELAAASQAVARVQAFVDHAKVQISRRSRQLADAGDTTSEHVLSDEGRLSGRDAKTNGERDRVCETLPEFESALAAGDCTGGHLDALAHHTKDLTDDERAGLHAVVDDLLDHATSDPVAVFDRTAKNIVDRIRELHRPGSDADELDRQRTQSRVKRWTDRDTGLQHTLISLDPLRDASLWNVIDHHLARLRQDPANDGRSFDELKVDAVQPGDGSGRVPEIVVHVDAASLCHRRHPDTRCETIDGQPVPVSTVQRLCCEAILQAVIVNPDRTVDQICAEQRTANRQQRRMLAAMYPTCAHPHCEIGFSNCRIHHIEWFTNGGRTVLANLVPHSVKPTTTSSTKAAGTSPSTNDAESPGSNPTPPPGTPTPDHPEPHPPAPDADHPTTTTTEPTGSTRSPDHTAHHQHQRPATPHERRGTGACPGRVSTAATSPM